MKPIIRTLKGILLALSVPLMLLAPVGLAIYLVARMFTAMGIVLTTTVLAIFRDLNNMFWRP